MMGWVLTAHCIESLCTVPQDKDPARLEPHAYGVMMFVMITRRALMLDAQPYSKQFYLSVSPCKYEKGP